MNHIDPKVVESLGMGITKLSDGAYEYGDGLHAENLGEAIRGVLSWCGCGAPEQALCYLLDGLRLVAEKSPDNPKRWEAWLAGRRERLKEHFKSQGAEYFFYYWLDAQKLTEHGSSVPGWLEPEGKVLLELLERWDKETEEEQDLTL